ncbi:MAG: MBL fold metallo-hydrolase [Candidatus Aenigmatarchaeota archaeon]
MGEMTLGDVKIEHFGHASFRITHKDSFFYIDPYIKPDDGKKSELILATHEHFDHCSQENIRELLEETGTVIAPTGCLSQLEGLNVQIIEAGDEIDADGIIIKAVAAYNTNKFRSPGNVFHPRGLGVGYVITIGKITVYHAGDTDFVREMKNLGKIDVALLPIGGTYTMDANEAAQAANAIRPRIAIPMHYSAKENLKVNPQDFAKLVDKSVEVRII